VALILLLMSLLFNIIARKLVVGKYFTWYAAGAIYPSAKQTSEFYSIRDYCNRYM